jgi:hypothetical protein
MLILLLACGKGGDEGTRELRAADFVPPEGLVLEYRIAGSDDTDAVDTDTAVQAPPTALILLVEGGWGFRAGTSWNTGTEVGVFPISIQGGLQVDGVPILPERITDGIGPASTWYGEFEQAVTVEIAEGRFAGTMVLAPGLGPIAPTLDGVAYDLVYYE